MAWIIWISVLLALLFRPRGIHWLSMLLWRHNKQLSWLLCHLGRHAWVPWLETDNGAYVTWCIREGCDHKEQYDL